MIATHAGQTVYTVIAFTAACRACRYTRVVRAELRGISRTLRAGIRGRRTVQAVAARRSFRTALPVARHDTQTQPGFRSGAAAITGLGIVPAVRRRAALAAGAGRVGRADSPVFARHAIAGHTQTFNTVIVAATCATIAARHSKFNTSVTTAIPDFAVQAIPAVHRVFRYAGNVIGALPACIARAFATTSLTVRKTPAVATFAARLVAAAVATFRQATRRTETKLRRILDGIGTVSNRITIEHDGADFQPGKRGAVILDCAAPGNAAAFGIFGSAVRVAKIVTFHRFPARRSRRHDQHQPAQNQEPA